MVYVGFTTTDSLLSRVIRYFTKSDVSHSFMAFELFGKLWILEAGISGVVILPWERLPKDSRIVDYFEIDGIMPKDLVSAMDNLGSSYDFTGLFGFIFPIVGRWLKKKWHNPWNNSKSLFCSEFVTSTLQSCNFPGAESLIPSDTSPSDLRDFLFKSLSTLN
jgi:hypothetical protein